MRVAAAQVARAPTGSECSTAATVGAAEVDLMLTRSAFSPRPTVPACGRRRVCVEPSVGLLF